MTSLKETHFFIITIQGYEGKLFLLVTSLRLKDYSDKIMDLSEKNSAGSMTSYNDNV